MDRHAWSLQRALLGFLEKHWDEPDEGIWEVRGPRRHFVHSKVMAWVAFDRAVKHRGGRPARPGGPLAGDPGRDPPAGLRAGLQRGARRVHPVLRLGRAGRRGAAHPRGRLPAAGRPTGRLHRGGHPARAGHRRAGAPLPAGRQGGGQAQPGWPAGQRGRVPGLQLLAGQRAAHDRPGRRGGRAVRPAARACATTSACSARSTTRGTGARSATRPQAFSHVPLIQAALNLDRQAGAHCRATAAGRPTSQRHGRRDAPVPTRRGGQVAQRVHAVTARPHILVVNGRKVSAAGLRHRRAVLRHRICWPGR